MSNHCKVMDKLPVIASQAEKTAQFFSIRRSRPGHHILHFSGVSRDALSANDMSEIRDLSLREGTLGQFNLPFVVSQQLKNSPKVGQMILKGMIVHQDIVVTSQKKLLIKSLANFFKRFIFIVELSNPKP